MKTGIPLPVVTAAAAPSVVLHAVPPPPRAPSSLAPTMRLDDPLKTEQQLLGASAAADDEPSWSAHGDDESLDEDALLALAEGDWDAGGTSRVKRQAKRLLALARKAVKQA